VRLRRRKAQTGIVYIDEIDKISRKSENPSITRDVSGEGRAAGAAQADRGTVASVPAAGRAQASAAGIPARSTPKNILFICGGAFSGLEKDHPAALGIDRHRFRREIRSKTRHTNVGKVWPTSSPRIWSSIGLIPEFVGRLPVVATLEELDESALIKILTEPKNAIVKQFKRMFEMEGVELEFRNEASAQSRARRSSARPAPAACARSSNRSCSTRCTSCPRSSTSARSSSTTR
jgi:ATP-dependent Clp protease ATP-binding subunit ClpX